MELEYQKQQDRDKTMKNMDITVMASNVYMQKNIGEPRVSPCW